MTHWIRGLHFVLTPLDLAIFAAEALGFLLLLAYFWPLNNTIRRQLPPAPRRVLVIGILMILLGLILDLAST